MFGLSFSELAVAALVAFILFGPEQFPVMARQAMQWIKKIKIFIHQAQRTLHDFTEDISSDLPTKGKIPNLNELLGNKKNIQRHSSSSGMDPNIEQVKIERDRSKYDRDIPWRSKISLDRQRDHYGSSAIEWKNNTIPIDI